MKNYHDREDFVERYLYRLWLRNEFRVTEFTQRGIPRNLKPAFQEYDIESLDSEANAFTIIERTLAYGDREQTRWLFSRYGSQRLAAWVKQAGWRLLPRHRLNFWSVYFGLRDLPRRAGVWPY